MFIKSSFAHFHVQRVTPKCPSILPQELYLFSKAGLLESFTVRPACSSDKEEILKVVENIQNKELLIKDLETYLQAKRDPVSKRQSYIITNRLLVSSQLLHPSLPNALFITVYIVSYFAILLNYSSLHLHLHTSETTLIFTRHEISLYYILRCVLFCH